MLPLDSPDQLLLKKGKCRQVSPGFEVQSTGVVTARGPFVLTQTVGCQIQSMTAGSPCRPVAYCPIRPGDGQRGVSGDLLTAGTLANGQMPAQGAARNTCTPACARFYLRFRARRGGTRIPSHTTSTSSEMPRRIRPALRAPLDLPSR